MLGQGDTSPGKRPWSGGHSSGDKALGPKTLINTPHLHSVFALLVRSPGWILFYCDGISGACFVLAAQCRLLHMT